MTNRKWLFAGLLSMVLVFSMILTACPGGEEEEKPEPTPATVEKPVITDQSGTKRYLTSMTVKPLSVTASVSDGGVLTYQWYTINTFENEGGEILEGETATTYTPPETTTEGTTYYYVVVKNPATEELEEATTASAPIGVIRLVSLPNTDAAVTVTANQRQYVRGFGGMSNAFGIGGTPPPKYMEMKDIETLYGPGGLGLTILRIMIWPHPLSQVISNQIEPQMNNASTYIRAAKYVNDQGGYVLASPWTPPEQYKTNAEARGHLKPAMYADYANYLREFASEMSRLGAPIYAISIQNEPSLEVGYDGMEWTAAEQVNFLSGFGDKISRSAPAVKGWGAGKEQPYVLVTSGEAHQIGGWHQGAAAALAASPGALANMDILAYHIYGGSGTNASVTSNGGITKEHWMTEYNINSQNDALYYLDYSWDYVWRFAETIDHVIRVNESNAYVWWYAKRFYSFVGDGAWGTVNNAVLPRGYVISHYAKYATDTLRVEATTTHPGGSSVRLTAFQRKSDKTTAKEQQVMVSEDSYSIVIYDQRTEGTAGTSLRVSLPAGFEASKVTGIISDSTNKRHAPVDVILNPDGNSADVTLPVNAIISLKFVK